MYLLGIFASKTYLYTMYVLQDSIFRLLFSKGNVCFLYFMKVRIKKLTFFFNKNWKINEPFFPPLGQQLS